MAPLPAVLVALVLPAAAEPAVAVVDELVPATAELTVPVTEVARPWACWANGLWLGPVSLAFASELVTLTAGRAVSADGGAEL